MRKYKIIFIVCFLIVLGFLVYTFIPHIEIAGVTLKDNKEGTKSISQEELRYSSIGERYISDEVKEHNEHVVHSDVELDDSYNGDMGDGEIIVHKTPIYGGDAVARHFENSSNYYNGELKLEEAFYNYIPELLTVTKGMTNTELSNYFELNPDIIESKLGIISAEEFIKFIGSMDKLGGKKYTKIDIPSNAITENYTNLSINFLIELTLEDGTRVAPVSISISHLKATVNQSVPYIKFVGLYKSQRPE